jgi:uncharacterized membrane-anchored protein YjiN (DUF445 family)
VPVVSEKLRSARIANRTGAWLSRRENAERVTAEAATVVRGAVAVLRDDEVQAALSHTVNRWLADTAIGPPAGRLLARFVAQDGHRPVVDLLSRRAVQWLEQHPEALERAVAGEAPSWTPRFVDERVAHRIHRELVRFAVAVRDEPDHPARGAIDAFLADFARDLQYDPHTLAQAERLKRELIGHPEVQRLVGSSWQTLRSMIVAAAEDGDGELRTRLRDAVASFGRRLAEDERMRAKIDTWIQDAAVYVVTTYRGEITALITDTVDAWDGEETSRKVEIQVGRDLQFIRINGTVVGALAGLLIYVLSRVG